MKNFLFILLVNSDPNEFIGWDITIWQIILIPIILALIELIKYIWATYISKVGKKSDTNAKHIKEVEEAVQEIIDKTVEDSVDDMHSMDTGRENEYILNIIRKHLDTIRKNIEADRVWIAKFHNGHDNETYVKKSYQLFSIIEESLAYGISSQKKFFYNIPVVFYNFILEKISKNSTSYIEDVDDLDPSLALVMKLQGIQSTGAVGVRNEDNELKAIIGYDFIKEKKEINEKDLEYIKEHCDLFLEYLELHRMYERKLEK